jgi:FdhD protein
MQAHGGSSVRAVTIRRMEESLSEPLTDMVAVEEPLQIRLRYWIKDTQVAENLALTMRTPGHDFELAAGFLYSEGVVGTRSDVSDIRFIGAEPSNEILVELSRDADVEIWRALRVGFINSSCGICGKRNASSLRTLSRIDSKGDFTVDRRLINALPRTLREAQESFNLTGSLHAAALIDTTEDLRTLAIFEDIGRHNALDKLIGFSFWRGDLPIDRRILFLSSRSSFELVQKAAVAGVPILATIGGPSSLAIDSARECGMTLIGFVREGRFNIYSGEWRINS